MVKYYILSFMNMFEIEVGSKVKYVNRNTIAMPKTRPMPIATIAPCL